MSALCWLQVSEIEDALLKLHETALDITNLLSYVSLNMAAVRKILKKAAKKLPTQTTYGPGRLYQYIISLQRRAHRDMGCLNACQYPCNVRKYVAGHCMLQLAVSFPLSLQCMLDWATSLGQTTLLSGLVTGLSSCRATDSQNRAPSSAWLEDLAGIWQHAYY